MNCWNSMLSFWVKCLVGFVLLSGSKISKAYPYCDYSEKLAHRTALFDKASLFLSVVELLPSPPFKPLLRSCSYNLIITYIVDIVVVRFLKNVLQKMTTVCNYVAPESYSKDYVCTRGTDTFPLHRYENDYWKNLECPEWLSVRN